MSSLQNCTPLSMYILWWHSMRMEHTNILILDINCTSGDNGNYCFRNSTLACAHTVIMLRLFQLVCVCLICLNQYRIATLATLALTRS